MMENKTNYVASDLNKPGSMEDVLKWLRAGMAITLESERKANWLYRLEDGVLMYYNGNRKSVPVGGISTEELLATDWVVVPFIYLETKGIIN